MNRTAQAIEGLDYLERAGMTVEQLRQLHHWGEDPDRKKRVTFASARRYFDKDQEMRENNAMFSDRVHLVAVMHRGGMQSLVDHALTRLRRD